MSKKTVKTATTLVWPYVYLLVTDTMSGKRNRYTLHMVSLKGQKETIVIGREITVRVAKQVIANMSGLVV